MNRLVPALLALALAAPSAKAGSDDTLDLLYLGDRPTLLRLHVTLEGKPYDQRLRSLMEKLFAFFDRDGNGTLDPAEVARIPDGSSLAQLTRGGFAVPQRVVPFAEADVHPKDGTVSSDELSDYFRRNGMTPVYLTPGGGRMAVNTRVNDLLTARLGAPRSGEISPSSCDYGLRGLLGIDANEDEAVSLTELYELMNAAPVQQIRSPAAAAVVRRGQQPSTYSLDEVQPLAPVREDAAAVVDVPLVAKLRKKYDRDGDGKLSPVEARLQKDFARLDRDGDGLLDDAEMSAMARIEPYLEARMAIDRERNEGGTTIDIRASQGRVHKSADELLELTFGTSIVQVEAMSSRGPTAQQQQALRVATFRQLLAVADVDKNGVIDRNEASRQQIQYLRGTLALADRDGDGNITTEEIEAVAAFQQDGMNILMVVLYDEGRSLFDMMDRNGDGKLGLREMRGAWSSLAVLDADGDGKVSVEDLPQRLRIRLGSRVTQYTSPASGYGVPTAVSRGPSWFQKMDRNQDGDVSPREFLGTRADFRRLDTDGDGLISPEEADGARP